MFDSVAQGGPGHRLPVGPEKTLQGGSITITNLPEHPSHGFVYEVVRMVYQHLRNTEGVPGLPLPNGVQGCYHRDPLLPEGGGGGKTIEESVLPGVDVGPENLRCRCIN